ncbi:ATP-binding cassette domain-containing protein [Streptomyces sp. XM4193]|uniref:ABC-F family ATP-binding cassette domain-containing protein n=1 Tax=Streptomyces sp. XM4193 TaxID=2929782 RepID=UPI001FF8B50C|nr:ABC-F family ATP-binding cassette domain-containing protein [Streptomyces sp. XM4193]MCK1796940.1 ATP-binding cassette domain-containing protein [Streptomyces sp. XM4193]
MPTQITARAVSRSFRGRVVLDSVTCSVAAGERIGIVGENDSGKSTLLRLFAGEDRPDQGEIVVSADGGVGHLAQEERLDPHTTVQSVVDRALGELRRIERRLHELEAAMSDTAMPDADGAAMAEYGDLLTLFELRGGYEAEARVERALHGLGLGLVARDRTAGSLSGGERVRLRLAALLASAPEVLLLDEPTNHLDDSAVSWLEDHLRTRRGTTVAVSHDRTFLERVATGLLEVDPDRRRIVRHGNGYAGYLAEHAAGRRRWSQAYEQWQADVAGLRETAATTARRVAPGRGMKDGNKMAYDRAAGRVQQSLAGRVRNAEERLRRLLADPVPTPPQPLRFAPVLRAAQLAGDVLDATGIAVPNRLDPLHLAVGAGGRLLITGPNGAGKSTLLRVLAGQLPPASGTVVRRGRLGHLPQDPAPGRPHETVLAAYARGLPGEAADHAEELLELGLFERELLTVPVGRLSTGQLQRLALARLVSRPSDVLLLDEPTNHLSPVLMEEVEAALARYPGAVVVASHDRRLRERWQGDRLHLPARAAVASPDAAAVRPHPV